MKVTEGKKQKEKGKNIKKEINEFCTCDNIIGTYSDIESSGFGYWDICANCNKKIEDGFHYYNHYDGEDNDDINVY